jgi:hypothetical protein
VGCSELLLRKYAPWTAVHEVKLRVMALQATTAEVAPQAAALRALPQALQAAAEALQAEALQATTVKLRVMALQAAPQAAALRALPQALQAAAEVLQAEALQAALQSVEEALWAVELPLRVMATGRRTRMSQG